MGATLTASKTLYETIRVVVATRQITASPPLTSRLCGSDTFPVSWIVRQLEIADWCSGYHRDAIMRESTCSIVLV
jgi:hypothetical protein